MIGRYFWVIFAALWAGQSRAAETIVADHVKVSWIVPTQFDPNETTIGLRFQIDPHWHIYWKNPGDSGTAPKFKFQSEQAETGTVRWPAPKRFVVGTLTNIGYENEVVFPLTIKPKIKEGMLQLAADLEWLVCQEECVPGSGQLTFTRKVGADAIQVPGQEMLNSFVAQVPRAAEDSPWTFDSFSREGDTLRVSLHSRDGSPLTSLDIFPVDPDYLAPARPLMATDGKSLTFKVQEGKADPQAASFVMSDSQSAWDMHDVPLGGKGLAQEWGTFIILLLSAFAGGVILNLMPCVLPVLSIKFFSLAKVSSQTRWREAMLYTLGVLATFTALGGIFLGLRAGGAAIGWGFQLQSPPIVISLVLLFWLMGLSFLGFFEFGNSLTRAAGKFENAGSFATGCLSVFIATPCTGPFMGTALGAATVLPAFQALTIFFFLGLGLASPFLALACFPKIRLPRPGVWMITLRQFLAFPLFATVVWLLWILGQQLGTDAWLYSATLGLALSFFIWLGKGRALPFKALAFGGCIVAIAYAGRWVLRAPLASSAKADSGATIWEDYEATTIADAQAKGQAVFVDFTAAWCVTCQVNKKAVLETEAAGRLFAAHKVKLIRGDWTNLDEKITTALAAFDRASVPLYLYYGPDGSKPKILPQILTLSDIEGLFP